jgi:hypothetical protein
MCAWPAARPDWMHGLAFAALPLACALLLLMGLAVAAGSEPQQAWLLGAAGESLRWGLYGVFLGSDLSGVPRSAVRAGTTDS